MFSIPLKAWTQQEYKDASQTIQLQLTDLTIIYLNVQTHLPH